ncbi:MAG TPA: YcfL family protein [Verrucomicrobiae bacterium]|nr:YcfL family protein [Verrucomicrobiae bacterium]
MKSILPCLAALALLTLATGCRSTGPYTPTPTADVEGREPVVLMDQMVQTSVTSQGVHYRQLPDGRLEAIAIIQSRDPRRIQVQIQCVFKDANGITIDDETPWQTLILTENGQEQVSFKSMNNQAKKATIRVRQAR